MSVTTNQQRSDAMIRATFVLLPRFNMMTLTGLIEPMRVANYLSPAPQFQWQFVSPEPGHVAASNGLGHTCEPLFEDPSDAGIIFILGSWGSEHYVSRALINWVRRMNRRGIPLCAVELGCYILARAGLLDGRHATTHWSWAPGFHEQFPDILLDEQLYTIDRDIMTCAGGTAGLDFMLRFVAEHRGQRLASEVADQMLHHPVRPADAPQRQAFGPSSDTLSVEVRTAIRLIEGHIAEPLPVPEIATPGRRLATPAGTVLQGLHGLHRRAVRAVAAPPACTRSAYRDATEHSGDRRCLRIQHAVPFRAFVQKMFWQTPKRVPRGLARTGRRPELARHLVQFRRHVAIQGRT